jgi:hypothetical protein
VAKDQNAYLYGIVACQVGEIAGHPDGIFGQKVQLLPVGDVGVILSYLDPDCPEVGLEDAVQHMRVLETAMAKTTVLPIRFGTIAESVPELKKMIIQSQFAIKKELNRLKDHYEVGIKGYWRKAKIIEELEREKDYPGLVEQAKNNPQAGLELGQRVEAVVNGWREKLVDRFHPELARLATASELGEIMSVELIYNGAFLVTQEQDLRLKSQLLAIVEQKLEDRFEFHYTTKLPPYNFVRLNLHWGRRQ